MYFKKKCSESIIPVSAKLNQFGTQWDARKLLFSMYHKVRSEVLVLTCEMCLKFIDQATRFLGAVFTGKHISCNL